MISLAISFSCSVAALLLYWRLAPSLGLMDRPNHRSQHRQPTVVGGGFPVALAVVVALLLGPEAVFPSPVDGALVSALILALAVTGLFDDRFNLPIALRLAVYCLVSAVAVLTMGPTAGWAMTIAMVLGLVWLVNLFNFMDGLDGFAVTQALCVTVGLAIIVVALPDPDMGLVRFSLVLAVALVPLAWMNWPPARLFMGDAGALFVGFYLGVLGLLAWQQGIGLGAAWLILMMPFIVDASLTLLLRVAGGHPPHQAHRDHAYQRLARRTDGALPVDLGLLVLQGLWQFPLACWAVLGSYSPLFAVIFSTIPTALLLAYLRRTA